MPDHRRECTVPPWDSDLYPDPMPIPPSSRPTSTPPAPKVRSGSGLSTKLNSMPVHVIEDPTTMSLDELRHRANAGQRAQERGD